MTKLLAEVLRKVSELPEERQDDAAHMLLTMLENDAARYHLTDEQVREVGWWGIGGGGSLAQKGLWNNNTRTTRIVSREASWSFPMKV